MLKDITLLITPQMAKDAQENEKRVLAGHLGTHFDVMNKEFPLEYTRRKAYVFDVSAVRDREIGIDCAGIKTGKRHPETDQYCADRGVFIVENLCGLKEIVGSCVINTYPMNYAGMSGLPCRVIVEV